MITLSCTWCAESVAGADELPASVAARSTNCTLPSLCPGNANNCLCAVASVATSTRPFGLSLVSNVSNLLVGNGNENTWISRCNATINLIFKTKLTN